MEKFNVRHETSWIGPYAIDDEVAVLYGEGMMSKGVIAAINEHGVELQAVNYQTGAIEADNTIWILRHGVSAVSPHSVETCEGCKYKREQQQDGRPDLASILDEAPDPNSDEFADWVKDILGGR